MKSFIWSALIAVALSSATVLSAQSALPQQPPAPAAPPAEAPRVPALSPAATPAPANQITVAGCLQESAPSAVGTSGVGTPGAAAVAGKETASDTASSDAPKFVLTKAVVSSNAATATAGAPSLTYRLIASESALKPHVGKKVELTGIIEDIAATTTAGDPPKLRVSAGKVLAASCQE